MSKPPSIKLAPIEVRDHTFLTFHVCPAPAGPRSRVLGSVTIEAVNDPTIGEPTAMGIVVYDANRVPLVGIVPGSVLLALAVVEQLLGAYGVDVEVALEQARAAYQVI